MKIHKNLPVNGSVTRKAARSSADGVFGKLLTSEIEKVQPVGELSSDKSQTPMHEAWHTLEESISLLDQAMHHIEDGDAPSLQLIDDIERLRSLLRQQVTSGNANTELKQADTLLAVEAERIRSMRI